LVQVGPVRRGAGPEASGPEQGPDRRRSHPDAERAELALDPHATPARVLPGQPEDERTDRGIDRWPAWATGPAVGPLPAHEFAMPPEEGRRGNEEGDPALTRDDPTRRCEEDPIDDTELRSARRPLQHAKLMAEDEDLEVLGAAVPVRSTTTDEQTDEGPDDQVDEIPHWPIVPGLSEHESGFLTPTGSSMRFQDPVGVPAPVFELAVRELEGGPGAGRG